MQEQLFARASCTEEIITLSKTELDRISVIQSIISRRLTQAQAAQQGLVG